MIKRLISGGQTGADSCIIAVGDRLGIPIGGRVPKGWRTEQGPKPELQRLGFTESTSTAYQARTRANVQDSDATLIFATNPGSDGTGLTVAHAKNTGKPFLVVDPFDPRAVATVVSWLKATQATTLNVAGNRESVAPGIAKQAEQVLYAALDLESIAG